MTKTNESSDTEIQQGEEQVVDTALPQQQQQQQQSGGPDITPHLRGDPLDMDDLSDDDSTVVQENQQNGNGTNNYNSSAKQKDSSNEKKHHEMGRLLYNWRLYFPKRLTLGNIIRWFMGNADQKGVKQTDEEMMKNLRGLARCLVLLREYLDTFGMPEKGGHRDQCRVLGEIASDLYAGGTPMWALEPVLKRCAEGLGQAHVQWQLFPRKCFMYNPTIGSTAMFKMDRGFNISKMDAMEPVVLRLCSFASNVEGVNNIPSRFPDPREFNILARQETGRTSGRVREDPKKLADKILSLSSRREGVLYFVNSQEYSKHLKQTQTNASNATFDDFWIVSDEERELFTRLACQEAMDMISEIDKEEEKKHFLHSKSVLMFFRGCASAGACAFWFDGSFQDMLVAGFLAILIALIGASSVLSKQERVVFEVVASFVVGLVAGAVALTWPDDTCFSAMGLAAVLDIMQGFKVVFAVIEVLSKHTMSGTADLIEGVLMTSLISTFLRSGQYVAASIVQPQNPRFRECTHGIDEKWYFLFVPLAALSWSGLFCPHVKNFLSMTLHGVLAYTIVYILTKYNVSYSSVLFASASLVSLSAGILSRFNCRQAIGNTISGFYVLLPGAYLVSGLYSTRWSSEFFTDIIVQAITIGIGGWTGTVICSPAILGSVYALRLSQKAIPSVLRKHVSKRRRRFQDEGEEGSDDSDEPMPTMLHF